MTHATDPASVGNALADTVRQLPEQRDIIAEWADGGLHSVAGEGLAQVPIARTVLGVAEVALGVRERLFLRKLAVALNELDGASPADIAQWNQRLWDDEGLEDLGERIISIIDQSESRRKARFVGQLFREYLSRRCDRATFLRSIEMVGRSLTEDLEYLARESVTDPQVPEVNRLVAIGLVHDGRDRLLLESSRPSEPSAEGALLIQAASVE